jgi:peroxiredoxin
MALHHTESVSLSDLDRASSLNGSFVAECSSSHIPFLFARNSCTMLVRSVFVFCILAVAHAGFAPTPKASFLSTTALSMSSTPIVKVGDTLPDVSLMQGQPDYASPVEVKLLELVKGKKVAMFAVPGAFTPGCSKSHLPSFITAQDDLKGKGVDLTICVATNDAYVMQAWGESSGGAAAGIVFLSDANGALTEQLGLVMGKPGVMMRSQRYSLIAQDGVVTHFFSADQESSNTWAPSVLAAL